jgi:hypothetical protein
MVELIFDENEDWEKRILCSDGSCIGTIGADGCCRECGKPYEGDLPDLTSRENKTISDINTTPAPENQKTVSTIISSETNSDDDWEKRVLCSDGCCIGTIGPDGLCRECGKPQ